jgi:hypothetical protein
MAENNARRCAARAGARRKTTTLTAMIVSTHMLACSVPVQFTQSPQLLIYIQRYTLCSDQEHLRERLINEVFGADPTSIPGKHIEHLLVRGSTYLRVASAPGDASAFMIEGNGSHIVYYGRIDGSDRYRFLGSADYRINDDGPLSISDLRRGWVTIRATVISTPSFTHPHSLLSETIIFLRVFVKEVAPDVYIIDREREHDIGWRVQSNGPRQFIRVIGQMQLIGRSDGQDLLDVRNAKAVAADYPLLLNGRLELPRPAVDVPFIEWQPAQPCKALGMDILL